MYKVGLFIDGLTTALNSLPQLQFFTYDMLHPADTCLCERCIQRELQFALQILMHFAVASRSDKICPQQTLNSTPFVIIEETIKTRPTV
jgi:hypothetical protein